MYIHIMHTVEPVIVDTPEIWTHLKHGHFQFRKKTTSELKTPLKSGQLHRLQWCPPAVKTNTVIIMKKHMHDV